MNKLLYIILCLPALGFACGGSGNTNANQNPQQVQKPQTVQNQSKTAIAMLGDETTQPLSDSDLQSKIKDKLAAGWFGKTFSDVDVDVTDGVVTISGVVSSDQDKQDVEKKVREFPEVKDVHNQLQVKPATEPAEATSK